jgi:pectate lyase
LIGISRSKTFKIVQSTFLQVNMKLSVLSLFSLALSATATPSGVDFSLVGFAKDNPIGTTTGGSAKHGKSVTVRTVAEFIKAVNGSEPTVVYAKGNFNLTSRVQIGSNKSLIGLGKGAQITGAGLNIYNKTNVIIQNFGFIAIPDDAMTIRNSTRVWIDHNEFTTGNFPALGPDAFDGQVDIIRASDWVRYHKC